ncbi:MAG: HDIG domain-containing protein [Bdellovibrio sp.]|nr:HDIG domain-containing protein [Bdellovibrio sp.]
MDYVSIRTSTLRGDQKINFDAYVQIGAKMILYLNRGDSFEGDRLKRLKEKKMRKMFILNVDETNYRSYLEKNIESAYDDKAGKDMRTRAEIIQGAQQSNVDAVFENPENAAAYSEAKEAASKYVQFISTNDQALASVMNIENTDKNIAHHGVTVSTLSIALAEKLKMLGDPKKTQLLALGALLHDYGHTISPIDLSMPVSAMSPENQAIWKQHPTVGAEKVQDKKHFDQVVLNIISQHEETINGRGPKGMMEKHLDPLAIIVGSANAMDRLITFEGVPKDQAAKKLMVDSVGNYPLNYIQLLNDIMRGVV